MTTPQETICDLILKQDSLRQLLETAITNYKKTAIAKRTSGYIRGRLEYVKTLWKDIVINHLTLERLVSSTPSEQIKELKYSSDYFNLLEEKFYDFLGILNDALESLTKVEPSVQKPIQIDSSKPSIRLPEISLPKFSGSYDSWRSFHDLFTSLVHKNSNLFAIQKFHYLKTSVVGEAEHLLRQYQITESNYEVAWSALKNRYQNTRVLVNTQLKILFNQQSLNSESAKGIKSLIDRTTECLCELTSLKVDIKNWDAILIYHVTTKLPVDTRRLWEEKLGSSQELPTFDMLKEFLESRFRTLEALTDKTSANQSYKSITHHITSAKRCFFCKESHTAYRCSKFLSLQIPKRLELVRSKQLCINCLSKRHKLYNCTSKFTCRNCGKKHDTLLHFNSSNQSTNNVQNKTNSKSKITHNSNNANLATTQDCSSKSQTNQSVEKSLQSFCTYEHSRRSSLALLSTALVKIKSKHGLDFTFRALIDSGSQTSFITENAAQKLSLKKYRTSIQVSGFGNSKTVPIKYQTTLPIQTRTNKTINVNSLIVTRITDLLPPSQINTHDFNHIKDLDLADPTFHLPGKIDILLGADAYSSILLEGLRKGPPGTPVAQNSLLGWILFGGTLESSNKTKSLLINIHNQEEPVLFTIKSETIPNTYYYVLISKKILRAAKKRKQRHTLPDGTRIAFKLT